MWYCIWIWKQDQEEDQEIDGKMKWGGDERTVGGEEWQEKLYNKEEWKKLLRMARNRRILHMAIEWMNEYLYMETLVLFDFPANPTPLFW
jgi:hypothetical protein